MNGIFNITYLQLSAKYFTFRGISVHLAAYKKRMASVWNIGSITVYIINVPSAIEEITHYDYDTFA